MSIDPQSSIVSPPRPQLERPQAVRSDRLSAPVEQTAKAGLDQVEASRNLTPTAEDQVDKVAKAAAMRMFEGSNVEVRGFHDDNSGRFVYQISDKDSGQLLAQTPPDALLRFFASYEQVSSPLVSVEA